MNSRSTFSFRVIESQEGGVDLRPSNWGILDFLQEAVNAAQDGRSREFFARALAAEKEDTELRPAPGRE